jgi:hypothetical protein
MAMTTSAQRGPPTRNRCSFHAQLNIPSVLEHWGENLLKYSGSRTGHAHLRDHLRWEVVDRLNDRVDRLAVASREVARQGGFSVSAELVFDLLHEARHPVFPEPFGQQPQGVGQWLRALAEAFNATVVAA